ncbi:MAG: BLUF domain-containing protein [Proteobacteria bacterium]|nr:BLUF domain-containing protein [Pseudomonadota bacterium]
MSSEDLEQIIASARHRNPDNGITGMLFFADGHQVLERSTRHARAGRLDRHTDLSSPSAKSSTSERWPMEHGCASATTQASTAHPTPATGGATRASGQDATHVRRLAACAAG